MFEQCLLFFNLEKKKMPQTFAHVAGRGVSLRQQKVSRKWSWAEPSCPGGGLVGFLTYNNF